MPLVGFRVPGRLVDRDGQEDFAVSCGLTVCALPVVMRGRLVGVLDKATPGLSPFDGSPVVWPAGTEIWAVMSECHRPLPRVTVPIQYVLQGQFPPFGLPNVIRLVLRVDSFTLCFPTTQCPDIDLVFDGANWVGQVPLLSGTLQLRLVPVLTGGIITSFKLFFDTCEPAGTFLPITISCAYPLTAGGAAPLPGLDAACCGGEVQDTLSVTASLSAYTFNRVLGRLVDERAGTEVYAFGECCVVESCAVDHACCGCEAVPREWVFPVAGVTAGTCGAPCLGWNGNWSLIYGANGSGDCVWQVPTAENAGICTPGSPWTLSCDGVNWTLSTTSLLTGNATYELPVAAWKCFGPNTMVKTFQGGDCLTFPDTLTLMAA